MKASAVADAFCFLREVFKNYKFSFSHDRSDILLFPPPDIKDIADSGTERVLET